MPTLVLKWYPQDLIGQAKSLQPIRIMVANAFSAQAFQSINQSLFQHTKSVTLKKRLITKIRSTEGCL